MSTNSKIFNASSKIVSTKELNKHIKQFNKQELTFGQKIFRFTVDMPASFIATIRKVIKLTSFLERERLKELNSDGTVGFWQDKDGNNFVTQETFNDMLDYNLRSVPSKKFQEKTNEIARKAFNECKNYRSRTAMIYDMGGLKPSF